MSESNIGGGPKVELANGVESIMKPKEAWNTIFTKLEPSHLYGTKDESVKKFIKQYNLFADWSQWDSNTKLVFFQAYLREDALRFYESKEEVARTRRWKHVF